MLLQRYYFIGPYGRGRDLAFCPMDYKIGNKDLIFKRLIWVDCYI